MALNVFELFGKIAIDSNDAKSGIDSAVGHAERAENKLAKTFKQIGTAFAAAFSVKAIVDFGKQCAETYASIAAEESAFAQIMGDYTETAQAKMDAVAAKTGVVSTRLTASMTSLTAKFKGLGYNVEDATTLAADGLLIASDAAAFWDMSLDDAMSHLNSFINGSYEGGEAIGLFANDTQMAAYAVEKGIVADTKAWSALDEATKQATRLDYAKNMQEQSGATGQAAKESQEYANVMANLKEHWRQFLGVVGKPILEKMVLPVLQKLNDFVPKLTESVQNGIVWLEEGFDKIASYFTDVFTEDGLNLDALPDALSNMFRDLGRSAGRLLTNFGRTLKNGWSNTVWPLIQKTFKATFGIDVPEWSEMEGIIKAWWDGGNGIAEAIASVCNWTLNLFGAPADVTAADVSSVLSSWWESTKGFVQSACSWALALFTQPLSVTLDQVKTALASWWTNTKGYVQKACNWVLDLFGAPEGTTEEKVQAILASWWSGVTGWIADACNWTLNLFGVPADVTEADVSSVLSTWWTNTKRFVQSACSWTLSLFNPPEDGTGENSAVGIITTWWNDIKETIEGICQIDLSKVNISGIFTAAETAYNSFIAVCSDFVNDVLVAVSSNPNGEIVLGARLSGLFDAGVNAVKNILTIASTLVADVVGAITGNEEDSKKIGEVFSELFGVASEVVIGVKDGALGLFQWLLDNGNVLAGIIGAIAAKTLLFAAANPAIAVITAITALIGAMTIDWKNFESNYPQLVQMFEDLTGMDFTNVANSLDTFQTKMAGIVDWFEANDEYLNYILMLVGAVAFATGHVVLGTALVGAGAGGLWDEAKEMVEAVEAYNKGEGDSPYDENGVAQVWPLQFVDQDATDEVMNDLYDEDGRLNLDGYNPVSRAIMNFIGLFDGSSEWIDPNLRTIDDWKPLENSFTLPNSDGTGGSTGSGNLIGTLLQQLSALKEDVVAATKEGVSEGFNGVTINAYVTAGDVKLDGKSVGTQTAPYVNFQLGWMNKLSRG